MTSILLFSLTLVFGSPSALASGKTPGGMALESVLQECYRSTLDMQPRTDLKVNGRILTAAQARNVQWISRCVLPNLPGTKEERLTLVARSTWWSLREGILDLQSERLFRYSSCHENGRDRRRSDQPLYNCPTSIWQVGIAAGQVAN